MLSMNYSMTKYSRVKHYLYCDYVLKFKYDLFYEYVLSMTYSMTTCSRVKYDIFYDYMLKIKYDLFYGGVLKGQV